MASWLHRILFLLCVLCSSVSWAATESAAKFPPKTLILGADAPEKRFFDTGKIGPACVGPVEWLPQSKLISLADAGDAVEFYLATMPPGMYLIAVHCRTGHQDSGWEYCMPRVRYKVEVDGQAVPMEQGTAKPLMRYKGNGWYDYSGWIVARDFVTMKPGNRVKISCEESFTYALEVAFLTPAQAMQSGWVVPDVMGKTLESVQRTRATLTAYSEKIKAASADKKLPGPDFTGVIRAFNAAADGYRSRIDQWREQFKKATAANDEKTMANLQKTADALRRESDQPLAWVGKELGEWCRAVASANANLPAVPNVTGYHARWAGILKGWIETYLKDLREASLEMTHLQAGRRLGRAQRVLDLRTRYLKEVATTQPVWEGPAKPANVPATPLNKVTKVCINGVWDFAPGNDPAKPPTQWETIRVPHGPWRETYGGFFNYGKTWDPQNHVGWYRTHFFVPSDWDPRSTMMHFEAVFHYTEVYLNGAYCGNHLGGFERFDVDLSQAVQPGKVNEMLVMVKDTFDSKTDLARNTRDDYSPNYGVANDLWGVNYGGIWQDVYLEYHPDRARIADVAIVTPVKDGIRLNLTGRVRNDSTTMRNLRLRFTVLDNDRPMTTIEAQPQSVASGASSLWTTSKDVPDARLWGVGGKYGSPYLYRLHTELLDGDRLIDERFDPFGFSQLWIDGDRFLLNGQPIFLAGGGMWYLQEDKFPLANRFYISHLFRWDRLANINIERIHRHGDMTEQFYAEASEMGMLMEQETIPTSFGCAPVDIFNRADLEDPIWRTNMTQYYRDWSAKHRNYPCIGLTSIENETFSYNDDEELMQVGLVMAKTVQESDPLRLYDFQGNHMMAGHAGPKFVNLHYAEGRNLNAWKEAMHGRPIINGEHNMGGHTLANNHDRKVAGQGEKTLADFWRHNIQDYLAFGADGLFVFVPAFQAYCSTSDWRKTTPWGDLFKDLSKYNPGDDHWACNFAAMVDIPWPSLSGPDAKAEKLLVGDGRGTFNWFDPMRSVCTPNLVHKALRETFPKQAPCNAQRCQEALVTVTAGGKPVAGVLVVLQPADNQPVIRMGATTDSQGTAWIVPRVPGRYNVSVMTATGGQKTSQITLGRYTIEKAGYDQGLVRLTLPAD